MSYWFDLLRMLRARSRALVQHERFFPAVSAVSAAVAVVAAMMSVYQARQIAADAKVASQPFFSFSRERIEGNPPKLFLEAKNVGGRAAVQLDLLLLALPTSLTEPPTLSENHRSGNDVAPSANIRISTSDPLRVASSAPAHYVVIGLGYRDPGTNERRSQIQVYFWAGSGKDSELTYVDRASTKRVLEHLRKELADFL